MKLLSAVSWRGLRLVLGHYDFHPHDPFPHYLGSQSNFSLNAYCKSRLTHQGLHLRAGISQKFDR